jgi:type VI secretion system protein ImpE
MNASELYKAGRLQEAITAQMGHIKDDPLNQSKRVFLFELLLFAGDLDRARKHLGTVKYDDPAVQLAVSHYQNLLEAEAARRKLFSDGEAPGFFMEPPAHLQLRLSAVAMLREGKATEATQLLKQADEAFPVEQLKGSLNEKPFVGLRDADDVFGPILEVMARGRYFWVPLDQVLGVAANAPKYPRELIYMPARLTLNDGQEGEVFLPALYPGTQDHADEKVKLGRGHDWQAGPGDVVRGRGSRLFLVGDDNVPLIDWRNLVFEETVPAPAAPAAGEAPTA